MARLTGKMPNASRGAGDSNAQASSGDVAADSQRDIDSGSRIAGRRLLSGAISALDSRVINAKDSRPSGDDDAR